MSQSKMLTKEVIERAKQIHFLDDFRAFMRGSQGLSDEDFNKPVPRIEQLILESKEKDPVVIFYDIMDQAQKEWEAPVPLPVNNDWHHFIVPGVILAAMRNNGYGVTDKDIREGMHRGRSFCGGSCGFAGTCGGAYGVGIVASLINRTTPLHDEERIEAMELVAETLRKIAKHARRCCKRSSFTAIESVVEYLAHKGYPLPLSRIRCNFSTRNRMCLGVRCPYHPQHTSYNGV